MLPLLGKQNHEYICSVFKNQVVPCRVAITHLKIEKEVKIAAHESPLVTAGVEGHWELELHD
jgi:hypothetical protein